MNDKQISRANNQYDYIAYSHSTAYRILPQPPMTLWRKIARLWIDTIKPSLLFGLAVSFFGMAIAIFAQTLR